MYDTVFLGGSITLGGAASDYELTSWRALITSWLPATFTGDCARFNKMINSGVNATPSWYGLVRLQTDVLDYAPEIVFVDFAVNDVEYDALGDRVSGCAPTAEALIRRIRTALPNTKIVVETFVFPDNYSYMTAGRRATRDKWINIANTYGLTLIRWDQYLESLMGAGYDDADVNVYLSANGNVHPSDLGHAAAADAIKAGFGALMSSAVTPLPDRIYAEAEDFEQTPIIRNGIDNDGETGTGWTTYSTIARRSSTADDTISWTGTFCSFGLDKGNGTGVLAWKVDDGDYADLNLANYGTDIPITSFARGVHTVTLKVVSGLVEVRRFLAV